MPRFGAHLSVAPYRPDGADRDVTGPAAALRRAIDLGCDCVQLFLRPNRQWHAPALTDADVAAFRAAAAEPVRRRVTFTDADGRRRWRFESEPLVPLVAHAAYLINLAGPPGTRPSGGAARQTWAARDIRRRSIDALADELRRAARLGIPHVVLHPGNHMGDGDEIGLRRVVEALDEILDETQHAGCHGGSPSAPSRGRRLPPCSALPVTVLLETTAGQGSAVGSRLEHLAWIIDHAAHPRRLAVCADTCHMFAAGYEFRTRAGYDETIRAIDRTVGLERLKVWHVNDCLKPLGSQVDRHTHIGRGKIGRAGFRRLVTDPRFVDHPMILETPKENAAGRPMDPLNLRTLRRLARA